MKVAKEKALQKRQVDLLQWVFLVYRGEGLTFPHQSAEPRGRRLSIIRGQACPLQLLLKQQRHQLEIRTAIAKEE